MTTNHNQNSDFFSNFEGFLKKFKLTTENFKDQEILTLSNLDSGYIRKFIVKKVDERSLFRRNSRSSLKDDKSNKISRNSSLKRKKKKERRSSNGSLSNVFGFRTKTTSHANGHIKRSKSEAVLKRSISNGSISSSKSVGGIPTKKKRKSGKGSINLKIGWNSSSSEESDSDESIPEMTAKDNEENPHPGGFSNPAYTKEDYEDEGIGELTKEEKENDKERSDGDGTSEAESTSSGSLDGIPRFNLKRSPGPKRRSKKKKDGQQSPVSLRSGYQSNRSSISSARKGILKKSISSTTINMEMANLSRPQTPTDFDDDGVSIGDGPRLVRTATLNRVKFILDSGKPDNITGDYSDIKMEKAEWEKNDGSRKKDDDKVSGLSKSGKKCLVFSAGVLIVTMAVILGSIFRESRESSRSSESREALTINKTIIKNALEGQFTILNLDFTTDLYIQDSQYFNNVSSRLEKSMTKVIFEKESDTPHKFKMVKYANLSTVIATFRIKWEGNKTLSQGKIRTRVHDHLGQSTSTFGDYEIERTSFRVSELNDGCIALQCSNICELSEATLRFRCTCPDTKILDTQNGTLTQCISPPTTAKPKELVRLSIPEVPNALLLSINKDNRNKVTKATVPPTVTKGQDTSLDQLNVTTPATVTTKIPEKSSDQANVTTSTTATTKRQETSLDQTNVTTPATVDEKNKTVRVTPITPRENNSSAVVTGLNKTKNETVSTKTSDPDLQDMEHGGNESISSTQSVDDIKTRNVTLIDEMHDTLSSENEGNIDYNIIEDSMSGTSMNNTETKVMMENATTLSSTTDSSIFQNKMTSIDETKKVNHNDSIKNTNDNSSFIDITTGSKSDHKVTVNGTRNQTIIPLSKSRPEKKNNTVLKSEIDAIDMKKGLNIAINSTLTNSVNSNITVRELDNEVIITSTLSSISSSTSQDTSISDTEASLNASSPTIEITTTGAYASTTSSNYSTTILDNTTSSTISVNLLTSKKDTITPRTSNNFTPEGESKPSGPSLKSEKSEVGEITSTTISNHENDILNTTSSTLETSQKVTIISPIYIKSPSPPKNDLLATSSYSPSSHIITATSPHSSTPSLETVIIVVIGETSTASNTFSSILRPSDQTSTTESSSLNSTTIDLETSFDKNVSTTPSNLVSFLTSIDTISKIIDINVTTTATTVENETTSENDTNSIPTKLNTESKSDLDMNLIASVSDSLSSLHDSSNDELDPLQDQTSSLGSIDSKISATICKDDEFSCEDKSVGFSCIPLIFKCDSVYDCHDRSDEHDCVAQKCDTNYQCGWSGDCLARKFVCDGIQHCPGKDDELNCETWKCNDDEFSCDTGSHTSCISLTLKCDGHSDCLNGTDEKNCSSSCLSEEYICPEGKCIPKVWTCDGVNDCQGGEDELDCGCNGLDQIPCVVGGCVPKFELCDGLRHCPDGSDEWRCLKIDNDTMQLQAQSSKGRWSSVCADNWTSQWTNLTCEQLGLGLPLYMEIKQVTESVPFPRAKLRPEQSGISRKLRVPLQYYLGHGEKCSNNSLVYMSCHAPECGMWPFSPPEISLHGERQEIDVWPSLGMLVLPEANGDYSCSASIITSTWVLASYNCLAAKTSGVPVEDQKWALIVGEASPTLGSDITRQLRYVQQVVVYPGAKRIDGLWVGDAALLKLRTALSFDPTTQPICLPSEPVATYDQCIIATWKMNEYSEGLKRWRSQNIQWLPIPNLAATGCNTTYYNGKLKKEHICASFVQGKYSPCYGNEGSPLMCRKKNGPWHLQGLMSHVGHCSIFKLPSVFIDVISINSWVQSTIGHHPTHELTVPSSTVQPSLVTNLIAETTTEFTKPLNTTIN